MRHNVQISPRQAAAAIAVFLLVVPLIQLPATMVRVTGPDVWLAPVAAILTGPLVIILLLTWLARFHPSRSLCAISEACLGRWGSKPVSLAVMLFCLLDLAGDLRWIGEFSMMVLLRQTPLAVIILSCMVVVVQMTLAGPEVIVRQAVIFLIMAFASIASMPAGLIREFDLTNMLPILHGGPWPVVQGAWPLAGALCELWAVGELTHLMDRPKQTFSTLVWGTVMGVFIVQVLVTLDLLVFSPELLSRLTLPTYYMVHHVRIGEFLDRIDMVYVAVWICLALCKGGLFLWLAKSAAGHLLGVGPDPAWLVWLVAPLGYGMVFIWSNFLTFSRYHHGEWPLIAAGAGVAIPGLLCVATWWQARRRRRAEA